ncbi:hypothetical protein [Zavarzinella formosa]|uniref:hypothetical protein n=1 Tax=Zavarzinella formosa TaxID=360055 RepID=UPI0002EBBDD5|nr:hypothetical protein [Zavarzinella formosa]
MEEEYLLKVKDANGKWQTYGNCKKNQYGNFRVSMKNTQALKDLVNQGPEWLNFSLFSPRTDDSRPVEQQRQSVDLSDEVPF